MNDEMRDVDESSRKRADQIRQRARRLKMHRVVHVGTPVGPEHDDVNKQVFKYIVMDLPVSKISNEKLAEMRQKSGTTASLLHARVAKSSDIPGLCDLYNASFFQCPDPYRPVTLDDMQAIFDHATILIGSLYGADTAFIVVKIEKQVAGGRQCGAPRFEGETKEAPQPVQGVRRVGVICGIAVHPRHRQRGVATALGLRAWDHLKDKGLDCLQCEVYEKNSPSLSFITWVGFRPTTTLDVRAGSAAEINPLERI